MSAIEKLERRLATLEAEVAKLKDEKAKSTDTKRPWWEDWFGAFENDPYFEKAMNYGREWRQGKQNKSKKKRKPQNGHS